MEAWATLAAGNEKDMEAGIVKAEELQTSQEASLRALPAADSSEQLLHERIAALQAKLNRSVEAHDHGAVRV